MILILFGLAGSGKSYVGDFLAARFNFYHQDADLWLTPEMESYIAMNKVFTTEMVESFTGIIIEKLESLVNIYPRIVISQGLYRKFQREIIAKYFFNYEVKFIQVSCSDEIIVERLASRGNKVNFAYASLIKKYFEPEEKGLIINNDNFDLETLESNLLQMLFSNCIS